MISARKIASNRPRSAVRARCCQYSMSVYRGDRSRGCAHIPCWMWPTLFMSKALSRICFGMTGSPMTQATVDPASQIIAGGLHGLDQRNQDDDHRQHHFRHEALVAIADAEIAEPRSEERRVGKECR